MPGSFDFGAFEKEAAQLLAQLRASADRIAAVEKEIKGGRATTSEVRSAASEPAAAGAPGEVSKSAEAEIRSRGLATDQLLAKQRELTTATRASSESERVMAQTMAQTSAGMQKSGALTNEFVDAAKRGEVTVRELGQQVAGTIAKFGGWIVAGSAVYFAFDALSAVKRGAIDASSGVNELQRVVNGVNTRKAQQEFQSLAGHFNLPIKEVADAAYEMGKVFNNQEQAFTAAKQVLYAVKIGELDTAAASRYLISIINGFHLPASRMADVLDQVNQAQNNFGVSTEDVLSGVAKASGAFHQASGEFKQYGKDYSYLLALITTGVKVTGQTGPTVGTAIARAPNFLRRPSNQEVLRQFGIEPNGPIEKVLNEAFKRVKTLTGKQVQELAAGIGGPQYGARVFTGLLSNYQKFKEVSEGTSPKASKGSAQRELNRQLGGVNEQVTKLGISLERIGEGLVSSHLLDSLGLMLGSINSLLSGVNYLVQDFSKLPDFTQKFLAYLIQASIVLRLMRRGQVGELIGGGPGAQPGAVRGGIAGFFGEGDKGFARRARTSLVNEQEALLRERGGLGGQLSRAAAEERYTGQGAVAANAALIKEQQRSGPLSAETAAAQTRQIAAERAYVAAQETTIALKQKEASSAERLASVQASLSRVNNFGGRLNTKAALEEARRQGLPLPAGYGKGGVEPPVRLATPVLPSQQAELDAVKEMEKRGLIPPGLESETQRATQSTAGATGRLTGLGQKFGGLRGGLGKMGGAMSQLLGRAGELAFAAFTIGFLADALTGVANSVGSEFEHVGSSVTSAKAAAERAKENAEGSKAGESFKERLFNAVTEHTNIGPVPIPTLGLGSQKGIGEERAEAEEQALATYREIQSLQAKERGSGKTVQYRYASDIEKNIKQVEKSGKSRKEIREALNKYDEQIAQSSQALLGGKNAKGELEQAKTVLSKARVKSAASNELVEKLQLLTSKEISERLQASVTQLGGTLGQGYNAGAAKSAALKYQALVQKAGASHDATSVQELAQARQAYFSGIQSAVSGDLQYALDFAKSPGERGAAYAQAISRYQAFGSSSDDAAKKAQANLTKLTQERAKLQKRQFAPETPGKEVHPSEIAKEQNTAKAIHALDLEIQAETKKISDIKKSQTEKRKYIKDIIQQLRIQEFEANSALRQAQEGAREALTANPIVQTEEQIKFLGGQISRAIAIYGKESQQVLGLIAEQRQARQQLAQNELSLFQSKGGLETAGIIEQVPKEKVTLRGAHGLEAQLAFVKSHENQFDPKTLIDLETQVAAAKAQLAFDIQQEANQVKDAHFGIEQARATAAGHTVRAAELAVQQARYDVSHAQTPLEKLGAQQNLIQSLAAKRDAVAQARVESITFEANISKITTQQEIEQLETLLHTYKLSLSARRQLREQIHSLKGQLSSEGEKFNLNIGDFALPTAYDIRRAVLGAGGGRGGTTVTQTNEFHIENHSNDPAVLGRAIGHALGRGAESAARSAGVV